MSKRKRPFQDYTFSGDEEYSPVYRKGAVICPECSADNLFSEVVSGEEWVGNAPINKSFTRHTCLNPNCGYFWEVSA